MKNWRTADGRVETQDGDTWRIAALDEIIEAVAAPDSNIRAQTELRFSSKALSPRIYITGELPDNAHVSIGVRRGQSFLHIPGGTYDNRIDNGRWFPISKMELQECLQLLSAHNISPDRGISLGSYLGLKADPVSVAFVEDKTSRSEGFHDPRTPRDFGGLGLSITLYPYQQVGAEFLTAMAERDVGVLLADQMGLGKTAQTIALLLAQRQRGPSLVVCPASLISNWSRELRDVAAPLRVLLHAGPLRTGIISTFTGFDVVITSYDTLVSDLALFRDVRWNIVVLDEAQAIRNPDTAKSSAVKELNRRVSVAVSGTPVENRLLDIWSIAEFVVPALLGSREKFEASLENDLEVAYVVGQVVSDVTLRRLVAEVAQDLPSLIQSEHALELPHSSRSRYTEITARSDSALAATTSLRVLCAHADGFGWETKENNPKVEVASSIMEKAFMENQKVLLFASFQQTLDKLFDVFHARYPQAMLAVLDGRVSVPERQPLIDVFSDYPGPGALFMNPQAAGVGLNITAANHVIHFNPEWNPALTSQATARAYRRKQALPVTVHHLFYEDTVEQEAVNRAARKREIAFSVDQGVNSGEEEAGNVEN